MATRDSKVRTTLIWVGTLVLLALALRVAFNMDASFDEETGRYLYSGNDPYYHDRTVRHIMETGEHLAFDASINYPDGGYNPNPPLFDWTTLPLAKVLDAAGATDPIGLALNLMVAVWGALTVIPVYHIGRDLWNRSAGRWAAFFMAVSAPHIGRSVFGFADHDATTMFWIALAFMFLVKALKALDHGEYVSKWADSAARSQGIREAITRNRTAISWSFLAGVALSATALTWKGYPYALAIMAIAVGLQLLQDHMRNKDSTAMFLVYLVPLVMVILVPYLLYYRAFPTFLDTTIVPSLYVLAGVLVAGLILVPTRDMPSIVVFPALAVAGGIGLLLLLVVFPSAGNTIFTGLGYFQQDKLYSTIAEAQRSELGNVAAQFGFFAFLIAFWGFFRTVRSSWKGHTEHMIAAAWGIVAIFMAFAAARFITNAAPVMAIFMGGAASVIGSKLGFDEVRRRYRKQHGQGQAGSILSSMTWRHSASVLMVGLLLVLPVTWVGVDAATSYDFEDEQGWERKWTGAFGIDFSIGQTGWLDLFNHLAAMDTDVPMEDRPAFIAWWDYGHWATDLGQHPTVADNFQNHYAMAGRFLASESETEAMAWLTLLLLNDNAKGNGGSYTQGVQDAIQSATDLPSLAGDLQAATNREARFEVLNNTVLEDGAIFGLYDAVVDATGKDIRYFGADARMWPTGGGGIFYAPVFLANKNPDDFISTVVPLEDQTRLILKQYGIDEDGNSYALSQPYYEDAQTGDKYVVMNGRAYKEGQAPRLGGDGTGGVALAGNPQGLPTQKFRDSMYARGFGSIQVGAGAPGSGLDHWRAIFEDTRGVSGQDIRARNTALLEYYRGVTVSGTVQDRAGTPLDGYEVSFVDGFGARHGTAVSSSDGTYEVIAPFSVDGDLVLEVRNSGTLVANRTDLQFTREQAAGTSVSDITIEVPRGTIEGIVFEDANRNGTYEAGNETVVAGAVVRVGDKNTTTDATGAYRLSGIEAGPAVVNVLVEGYEPATSRPTVLAGDTVTADVALVPSPTPVALTVQSDDGPVEGLSFRLEGIEPRNDATGPNGTAFIDLAPGDYTFVANGTVMVGEEMRRYQGESDFTVQRGGQDQAVVVTVTRVA